MPALLAEVTRGPIVESRHYGHVAVCDSDGRLIAYAGEPETVSYMRSAAKPIQTLNVFMSGAYERFGFTDEEIAIMCGSHFGEESHKRVVLGLLDKIGLSLDDMLCGCPLSIKPALCEAQLRENRTLYPYNSDCSGKHCGFLASCLAKGYPIQAYNRPEHWMQKDVLRIFSEITRVPEDQIPIGIDGCTVPVHAIPVRNMAMAYARMTTPEHLPEKYREPAKIICRAMNAYPEMIGGNGGFCTEFRKATPYRFIGKCGAEANYCVGVIGKNMGIAVKIDDGNMQRPLYPVVMSVLDQLGLLSEEEKTALTAFITPPVLNDIGEPIGVTRPAFKLTYV